MYKKIITAVLLIFILLSVVFFIFKEFTKKNQRSENNTQEIVSSEIISEQNILAGIEDTISNETASIEQKVDSNRIDIIKKNKKLVKSPSKTIKPKIIAYYFHTTRRCATCLTIENYSKNVFEQYFTDRLQNKTLVFQSLNTDASENGHYIQDYELYANSLVISLHKNNEQIKWKNLTDVWTYVRNKESFDQYVKSEVEKFIEELE